MLVRIGSCATIVALAACARPAAVPRALPAPQQQGTTEAAITESDVKTRIGFLASDALKGRDTPSPGLERAAQYIAEEFKAFGLQPGGDSSTFLRRYDYTTRRAQRAAELTLQAGSFHAKPGYASEFFLAPGQQPMVDGDVQFLGTLTAGTKPGAEVAGKVIAYFIPGATPDQAWIGLVQPVVMGAMQGGPVPAAVVLVLDPAFNADAVAMVATQAGGGDPLPFPIVGVRYDRAKEWFAGSGFELDKLRDAAPLLSGPRIVLNNPMSVAANRPPNVVGILPGSDPALRDTYIVYSAHMDHVGVGRPNAKGDSIFNGADDDASGTSAVIELAQAFAAQPVKPKRSIIFLLVSGEEKGLLGSAAFVKNPPVPAAQMVANINLDMIGRNNPDSVVAIGQDYSSLGPLVQKVVGSPGTELEFAL